MLNVEYNQNCEEYKLNKAILFYGNGYKTLATLHKIENKKLLAGKSLSVSDLEELFHSLVGDQCASVESKEESQYSNRIPSERYFL